MTKDLTRRRFLQTAATAAAGFTIVPRHVLGGVGYTAPSDRLRILGVGAGGKGESNLKPLDGEYVIGLCDIDAERAADTFAHFPQAARYTDFRRMYDELLADADAVVVSTPDHTHAVAALRALYADKHVYCEKPLVHNIREARLMTEAARARPHLATQMGNQGASQEGIRRITEWLAADLIGEVHTVHAWTNRPIWPQGNPRPTQAMPKPAHVDWESWVGPAPMVPYHKLYHPFAWRGWWDFGTGALGDMGCHIIDASFYALELGYPTSAEASVVPIYSQNWNADYTPEACPVASKIILRFPARGPGKPAVKLTWHDGGLLPERPRELQPGEQMGGWGGGVILEGTRGKLMHDVYANNPRLLPLALNEQADRFPEPTLPRVPDEQHQLDWIAAIREGRQPSSHFGKAGPLTETVLMGNLAVRAYDLRMPTPTAEDPDAYDVPGRGNELLWDGEAMRITNLPELDRLVGRENGYREGWELPTA